MNEVTGGVQTYSNVIIHLCRPVDLDPALRLVGGGPALDIRVTSQVGDYFAGRVIANAWLVDQEAEGAALRPCEKRRNWIISQLWQRTKDSDHGSMRWTGSIEAGMSRTAFMMTECVARNSESSEES